MGEMLAMLRDRRLLTRLGFASFDAYTKERLGQTGRWGSRLIELHRSLDAWPDLGRAFETGVLPTTKVLALARVVTATTASSWVRFARTQTFRAVSRAVAAAAPGGLPPTTSVTSSSDSRREAGTVDADAVDPRALGIWTQMKAPASVAHLYDYTLDVVRRVAGEQLPTTACLASLCAEYASARAERDSALSRALDRLATRPLAAEPVVSRLHREATTTCRSARHERKDIRDPFEADALLRELARRRQQRHGVLAASLAAIKEEYGWQVLGYDHFDAFCHGELGISGRFARQLVHAHHRFRELPLVASAYLEGRISWSKVRLLLTVCRRTTQIPWLDRAALVTTRYLEEEVATCQRLYEQAPERASEGPLPLTHQPPCAELSPLRPGAGLWGGHEELDGEVHSDGPQDASRPDTTLRHTFSSTSVSSLPCTIRFWLPWHTYYVYGAIAWDIQEAAGFVLQPWECLFVILRHFLSTWDRTERVAFATEHNILHRDGYQCAAPGCRMRRTLEVHHVRFRSRGGSDRPENLVTLCAVHHRVALHDESGLACLGTSPGALRWRLGRTLYHGDVRVRAPVRPRAPVQVPVRTPVRAPVRVQVRVRPRAPEPVPVQAPVRSRRDRSRSGQSPLPIQPSPGWRPTLGLSGASN